MRQRRGIALITVLLISALVLAAVGITVAQVMAEKTITTSQSGFKRALSVAEAGITETVTNCRNAVWSNNAVTMPDGSYLTVSMVNSLAAGQVGTVVTGTVKPWPDAASTFQVKIKKLAGPQWDGSSAWENQMVKVGVYSSGEVYVNGTRSSSQLVARRVLYAEYNVVFNLKTSTIKTYSGLFDYGLLSGGAMNLGGNSQITDGSIRANGIVDVGSKQRLDGNPAHVIYTDHGVTGKKINDPVVKPGGDFQFPAISMAYYRGLADDFKNGAGFYSGTGDPTNPSVVYPNTSSVTTLIQADLGPAGTASTWDQVMALYTHLQSRSNGWASVSDSVYNQVWNNLARATYYINQSTTITGGTASGTVVFDCPSGGGVSFHGGTLNAGTGLAVLVNGDLFIGNGNTTIYGGVYATGKIQQMNGSFTVYGSVATQGAMDKVNGDLTVHYVPVSGIPTVIGEVPGNTVNGQIESVNPVSSGSWSEKDLNAFTNAS